MKKHSEQRRPPTGGGKRPTVTPEEEMVVEDLASTHVLDGVPGIQESGMPETLGSVNGNIRYSVHHFCRLN